MMEALMCTVGNMFSKGARHKYPKKPYELFANSNELSDEEKKRQTELLFAKMNIMATNFNLSKQEKGVE